MKCLVLNPRSHVRILAAENVSSLIGSVCDTNPLVKPVISNTKWLNKKEPIKNSLWCWMALKSVHGKLWHGFIVFKVWLFSL